MNILNLKQGSTKWIEARTKYFTASEAPVMLGVSKYKSRSDLLNEKLTGIIPDIEPMTQRLFDNGHAAEQAAKPFIESKIGEDLYATTGALEINGIHLLASFDGLTMSGKVVWECKLLNKELSDTLNNNLPLNDHYTAQLEQQLLVSGAEIAIFTASTIDATTVLKTIYKSNPAMRKRLISGWRQFDKDLKTHVYTPPADVLVGHTPDQLPALRIQVTGMVESNNVDEFRAHAVTVFDRISTDLTTDQEFADAEKIVRFCKDVESKIDQAKTAALAQTKSIDDMFRALDDIKATSREKRLALDKLIKSKKEAIKIDLVNQTNKLFRAYVNHFNSELGSDYMPHIDPAFGLSIKGLRSIDSIKDALNTACAAAKIEASSVADLIRVNLKLVEVGGHDHLVPDIRAICDKNAEDFKGLIALRLQAYQAQVAAEEKKKREAEEAAAVIVETNKGPISSDKLERQPDGTVLNEWGSEVIEIDNENQSDVNLVETPPAEEIQSPPESILIKLKTLPEYIDNYSTRNELAARTAATFKKHFLKFIDEYLNEFS